MVLYAETANTRKRSSQNVRFQPKWFHVNYELILLNVKCQSVQNLYQSVWNPFSCALMYINNI